MKEDYYVNYIETRTLSKLIYLTSTYLPSAFYNNIQVFQYGRLSWRISHGYIIKNERSSRWPRRRHIDFCKFITVHVFLNSAEAESKYGNYLKNILLPWNKLGSVSMFVYCRIRSTLVSWARNSTRTLAACGSNMTSTLLCVTARPTLPTGTDSPADTHTLRNLRRVYGIL